MSEALEEAFRELSEEEAEELEARLDEELEEVMRKGESDRELFEQGSRSSPKWPTRPIK